MRCLSRRVWQYSIKIWKWQWNKHTIWSCGGGGGGLVIGCFIHVTITKIKNKCVRWETHSYCYVTLPEMAECSLIFRSLTPLHCATMLQFTVSDWKCWDWKYNELKVREWLLSAIVAFIYGPLNFYFIFKAHLALTCLFTRPLWMRKLQHTNSVVYIMYYSISCLLLQLKVECKEV